MATCQFCGRQFTNTQAVRAHLKACAVYHGRDQATGSALSRVALGTVPEAADAGTELPNGEGARDGQRAAARQRAQERADRQALREAEEFLRREAAERQQAEAAAQERAEAKQRLVERGMSVADRELRADPDLDLGDRQDIREWVQSVLKEELSGAESNEEVNHRVNDLLDEAFDEDNDQDEDEEAADDFDEGEEDADDD